MPKNTSGPNMNQHTSTCSPAIVHVGLEAPSYVSQRWQRRIYKLDSRPVPRLPTLVSPVNQVTTSTSKPERNIPYAFTARGYLPNRPHHSRWPMQASPKTGQPQAADVLCSLRKALVHEYSLEPWSTLLGMREGPWFMPWTRPIKSCHALKIVSLEYATRYLVDVIMEMTMGISSCPLFSSSRGRHDTREG